MDMNIRKLTAALVLVLAPSIAQPSWEYGPGIGLQYGGLLGAQASYLSGENRFNAGAGYLGFSLGYERNLSPRQTLGIHAFGFFFFGGGAVSYTFYPSGSKNEGWRLGIDVGKISNDSLFGNTSTDNPIFFLPYVGYQF